MQPSLESRNLENTNVEKNISVFHEANYAYLVMIA